MTAIAHVGIADPLFSVAKLLAGPTSSSGYVPSGIYCLGALTAPDGQFLYLSLIGRDTAFQELRGLMTAARLTSFLIQPDEGEQTSGWFSREWLGQMEYHGAKLQTQLFGEVSQMIFYHPLLNTPDKANQTAVLPYLGEMTADLTQDAWQLVKHVCEVPLLEEWRDVVMQLLVKLEWLDVLSGFGCNAAYIKLGSNIGGLISANIRSGALCVDADTQGCYAFPDNLTIDLEFNRSQQVTSQAKSSANTDAGGFWDDADIIDCYSRAQAIADGVLVDVSAMAEVRESGFKVPVALTAAVWDRFVEWNNADVRKEQQALGQSTAGRLWDVMYMASLAIRRSRVGSDVMFYELYVIERDGFSTTPRSIKLKLHTGSGDKGEHVITIMLPEED